MSIDAGGLALPIPPQFVELVARRAAQLVNAQREPEEPTWMDMAEAAAYLRKPAGTFKQEVQRGQWPTHREGKRIYFDRAELDKTRRDRAGR